MRLNARHPDDPQRLHDLIAKERHALQRDRYRAALMAIEGTEAVQIARTLGRARRSAQAWAYAYRDGGIEALRLKKRGGKRPRMSREEREGFAARVAAGPTDADGGVCVLRGRDFVRILREEFGRAYSLGGAYDLLHQLGYTPLRPRPRHRKSDPAAQEAFMAAAPLLSGA